MKKPNAHHIYRQTSGVWSECFKALHVMHLYASINIAILKSLETLKVSIKIHIWDRDKGSFLISFICQVRILIYLRVFWALIFKDYENLRYIWHPDQEPRTRQWPSCEAEGMWSSVGFSTRASSQVSSHGVGVSSVPGLTAMVLWSFTWTPPAGGEQLWAVVAWALLPDPQGNVDVLRALPLRCTSRKSQSYIRQSLFWISADLMFIYQWEQ